jgi:rhodanese-related sulfurtransferase
VTHFVAGLGTCGTITGTGRFLKEKRPEIQVIGVYPDEGHDIPGVRSMAQLQQTKLFFPEEYDQTLEVANREAYEMCLRIVREESIIAGPSSGMALTGALRAIPDEPGTLVVVIFPDDVFKYASSLQRHFPDICPPDDRQRTSAASQGDQLLAQLLENLKNKYDTIKADDLHRQMGEAHRPLVIDVRSPDLYAESHIAGAISLPQEELANRSGELPDDRDAPVVMVCNIGKFSKQTTLYLKSLGYRNVRSMKGGLNEWVRKGHPIETNTVGSR